MVSHINGFKLEVTIDDGLPHVRISFGDGTVVLDTDRLSVSGLEKLPEVFAAAASIAARELDHVTYQEELLRRKERALYLSARSSDDAAGVR